jgi:hypothetical protein
MVLYLKSSKGKSNNKNHEEAGIAVLLFLFGRFFLVLRVKEKNSLWWQGVTSWFRPPVITVPSPENHYFRPPVITVPSPENH